ncbi:small-conductance mechanosensitive channel [Actinotalea ferrariae CF5-4]|uniref:Small-conductance mechanosensitive channel n=1 Tax=Actinotalea ferrariae CF5-4 TaxID=948458 RepID=A0A021VTP0_9CELL|nr:mechanosensitive ion channel family protein [Actinotalea ferrariae]EYR64526.1 small-conductance mechanosensitive channel [Actinotalea ferrariae CF5-4]
MRPIFVEPDPSPSPGLEDIREEGDQLLTWVLGAPLQSLVAVLVGVLLLAALRWTIARAVRSVIDGGARVRSHTRRLLMKTKVPVPGEDSDPLAVARRVQRAETMGSVLRSVAGIVVTILVVTALAEINDWNLGPLLASAGVVGVALGFGAQTLVKDFLAGIFMLVEDQYGVGDVVDLGEAIGTVEAVGLRVTQVRDLSGTLWYVRNGEILRVGNMTQGWSKALVEVTVPPDADVEHAAALLTRAAQEVAATRPAEVLGEPEVTGYESLSAESVMVRMTLKVAPAKQWAIQREVRARVRELFVEEGVGLALPRQMLVERAAPAATTPAKDDAGEG